MNAQAHCELNFAIPNKTNVISVLSLRVGASKGIDARTLADICNISEREVRKAVSELREDGAAICARPSTGYFVASNAAELEECCQFLRSRAMHSLHLESRLRRIPLADLLGQLHLPT